MNYTPDDLTFIFGEPVSRIERNEGVQTVVLASGNPLTAAQLAIIAQLDAAPEDTDLTTWAPPSVTPAQMRIFLRRHGVDPAGVETAISAMDATEAEKAEALDRWNHAVQIEYASPLTAQLAAALGFDDLRAVFLEAALIE
jgi:hypothetical protein